MNKTKNNKKRKLKMIKNTLYNVQKKKKKLMHNLILLD